MAADVGATCGTTTATSGPDDSTINFDWRHNNGDGGYTTVTGGTTTRHDSGKGQRATECTTTSTGGMMTIRGSRATGGTTTATSGPDDSTIN